MKLTLTKVLNLRGALSALDSYEKAVGDKTVRELYQLGGPLRLRIARNLNLLDPEISAYQKARNALVVQHTNGADKKVDMANFVAAENELLESEIELDLKPIKEHELQLDKNPVPGTVLAGLMPILEE